MFSDGGNFCPEEIDDFRKKLEKMSTKIDSAEGFVMADLEGMESKRLDQAMKISNEFEDRCVRCSLTGRGWGVGARGQCVLGTWSRSDWTRP